MAPANSVPHQENAGGIPRFLRARSNSNQPSSEDHHEKSNETLKKSPSPGGSALILSMRDSRHRWAWWSFNVTVIRSGSLALRFWCIANPNIQSSRSRLSTKQHRTGRYGSRLGPWVLWVLVHGKKWNCVTWKGLGASFLERKWPWLCCCYQKCSIRRGSIRIIFQKLKSSTVLFRSLPVHLEPWAPFSGSFAAILHLTPYPLHL